MIQAANNVSANSEYNKFSSDHSALNMVKVPTNYFGLEKP